MGFFNNHNDLNDKLDELESQIDLIRDSWTDTFLGSSSRHYLSKFKPLINEIFEDFKSVRYPSKQERTDAWERFMALKNDAESIREEKLEEFSNKHYDVITDYLSDAHMDFFDRTVLWSFHSVEGMKKAGQALKQAFAYFKENKNEMTKDHKDEIYERLQNEREMHQQWWNDFNEYRDEQRAEKLEKLEKIINGKRYKYEKSEEFLERLKSRRDEIEENIESAYSDSYRERQEERLNDINDKIEEVEKQITDLEENIDELQEKINKLSN